ncbi:hypothetical protein [Alienimonas sp. DA493]|uniref:hypothetical protein n=1 Tax=Alienimonas sp. DA493 TaxID=3373605 RepID=UPI003754E75E
MAETLAYFLTAHTYGSRLHGDSEGSVDAEHAVPGTPTYRRNDARARFERSLMTQPAMSFGAAERRCVQEKIAAVCAYRGWSLTALHVRTTHLHAVVVADGTTPERVLNDFKSYATRGLREAGRVGPEGKVWSRHGSTKYVSTQASLRRVIEYVVEGQGDPLDPPPICNL